MRKLTAAVISGAVWLLAGASAVAAAPGSIKEIPLGASADVYVSGLTSGPDGNLWFADLGCLGLGHCAIARITPGGRVDAFRSGLAAGSVPVTVVAGRDGDVWFTDQGRVPAIGRITPQGRITEFTRGLPAGGQPFEIALGPDGNLWFTDQGKAPAIGRITAHGQITEFRRGLPPGSVPFGIAAANGGLWFTDRGCSGTGRCAIGRVSAGGRITESAAGLRAGSQPLGLAAGRGGWVWFADSSGAIGRITPAGQVSERSSGLRSDSSPVAISAGPDGNMWFTDEGVSPAVGRVTPGGVIHEFSAGLLPGTQPAFVAAAPDGRVWFSDEGAAPALGTITTGEPPALRSPPRVIRDPHAGTGVTCRRAVWTRWAGLRPTARLFASDGYRWLRNGRLVAHHSDSRYAPVPADGGTLACRETVTYPPPLTITASATSAAVTVGGAATAADRLDGLLRSLVAGAGGPRARSGASPSRSPWTWPAGCSTPSRQLECLEASVGSPPASADRL